MNKKTTFKNGFTLVELTLSIVFISILSLTIMMIINNLITSYRRGITLNTINTVGMDLVDDMRAAVQNAPVSSLIDECNEFGSKDNCVKDKGYNFVSVVKLARVKIRGEDVKNVPVFGAFCTGSYSYIWNSGYYSEFSNAEVLDGVAEATLTYQTRSGEVARMSDFKLLKVRDDEREACVAAVKKANRNYYTIKRIGLDGDFPEIDGNFNITSGDLSDEPPVELLKTEEENNLAIYNIASSVPAENKEANNLFYAVSFILGTVQGGVNVQASGNFCVPPEDFTSGEGEFDYCAINKFNFAAQAIGG